MLTTFDLKSLRARIYVPTLENVYETLRKQHSILIKEKEKIGKIKQKLGIDNIGPNPTKLKALPLRLDSR